MRSFSLPIRFVLFSSFFMTLGHFAVMAFLAIYLSNSLHFSAMQVGTILTALTITSRIFPLCTGILADRIGYITMMITGMVLRGIGFLSLGIFSEFHAIMLATIFIGFGTAFYEPSARAVFGSQPAHIRKDTFTYLNLFLNGGAIIGPIAGGILLQWNPMYPFIFTGSLMFVLAFLFFFLRSHFHITVYETQLLTGIKAAGQNKPFLYFSLIMVFFYTMFTQLTVALPLHMNNISDNQNLVGLVITINAITGFLFMIIFKYLFKKYHALSLVKYGVLLMGLSFLLIPFSFHPNWLLMCVILFTIGETLVLPNADIAVANFSNEQYTATYFGFFQLSLALGFTMGNYTGTFFTKYWKDMSFPWIIFGLLGVVGFSLLHFLNRTVKMNENLLHLKQSM
ncbi:MFS transporter [Bacillus cereus group sp. BfR-BA-01380]|uniref:MDR family MFS transporter n=1 Tax=Bacillus cereus group sp. BfR-BA-01380 TaxID=2920324 RepID=UPI001F5AD402|nr:MFS transporter [Bacillus cereus group sp. BfR-BA-01380]